MKKLLFLLMVILCINHAHAQSTTWDLLGNAGTSPGTNFMGTQDDEDVIFKRYNIQAGWLQDYITHSGNTSWGVNALNPLTSGISNTAIGCNALFTNTSGRGNIAIGTAALYSNNGGYSNVAIGLNALYHNTGTSTTGSNNVAAGYYALYNNTTGIYNIAAGYQSLYSNLTGGNNIAAGYHALYSTLAGSNIGIGNSAGTTNTTGTNNTLIGTASDVSINNLTNATALGFNAKVGQSNCLVLGGTGTSLVNVGVGITTPNSSALLDLTSTTRGLLPPRVALTATNSASPLAANVAGMILYNTATAGTSPYNVTPGYYYNNGTVWVRLMDFNSSGWNLTGNSGTVAGTNFLGTTDNVDVVFKQNSIQAGLLDYINFNTAFGVFSLPSSTTGVDNVANGYLALTANTTGNANTAIGEGALTANTTGYWNSAIGNSALVDNTQGYYNTANGADALDGNTTGDFNVGDGQDANYLNTTGSYNTALGVNAGVNAGNLTYATAIGAQAVVNNSYEVVLGNSSVTETGYFGTLTSLSDGRFKKNIKENVPGLEFIKQLKPVTYNYDIHGLNKYIQPDAKQDSGDLENLKEAGINAKEKIVYTGFVAQDVEQAANKIGYDFSGLHKPQNDRDPYGLGYVDFVAPIVKAIQELSTKNDSLSAENDSLQSAITQQQQVNNNLQQQLNDIKSTISQMQFAMSQCCNSFSSSMQSTTLDRPTTVVNLDQARLDQNIPNPYSTTTIINYYLPPSAANAQLLITDLNGQLLKAVTLIGSGNGQVNINAGTLTSGDYFYTLLVNGQKIDTRQMVLTK